MTFSVSVFHGDGADFEALVDVVYLFISNVAVCSFVMATSEIKVSASKEVADFRISRTGHLLVH